jgi:hypothetical protein
MINKKNRKTNEEWYEFFGDKLDTDKLSTDIMLAKQKRDPNWNKYVPSGSLANAKGMDNFSHFMLAATRLPAIGQISIYEGPSLNDLFINAINQPEFHNSQLKYTFLKLKPYPYSNKIEYTITPIEVCQYLIKIDSLLVYTNGNSNEINLQSCYEGSEIMELLRQTKLDEFVYDLLKQIKPNRYYDHGDMVNQHQDSVYRLESLLGAIDPWYHTGSKHNNPVCIKTILLIILDIFKYVVSIENIENTQHNAQKR